ncbi:hypothetical protein JYU20_04475 [Bacteroidales bacterium AH-315-I05]|nr:hypothetical protein [Bacteroidales bacterium AH-315-I05]
MKKVIFLLVMLSVCETFFSQQLNSPSNNSSIKKGKFYFFWGYNRSFYGKTNLHITGPNYDFTLYGLEATDRPSKFGAVYVNPATFTVPQYNYRLGYFLTDKFLISAGVDHMKYVVTKNQQTTISGIVTEKASEKYAGYYLNEPIKLTEDLLIFEHTNGFNLLSLDFEYLQPIHRILNNSVSFAWNVGIGGIWVVTKTDVRVFGDGLDNDFHLSGYSLQGKTGPRIEYKNRFFFAAEVKSGYAVLPSVLIKNKAPEIGNHNVFFYEYCFVFGVYFNVKPKKRDSAASQ